MEDQAMKIATMAVVCVAATFNAGAYAVALDDLEITHIFRREINSLDKTLDSTSNI
jgi:hypothetical protein